MTRHYIFRSMTFLAIGLIGVSLFLYYAIQWGIGMDAYLYQLVIVLIAGFAAALALVILLLQLAVRGKVKNKAILNQLRLMLLFLFPVLYVFKPILKHSFKNIERDLVDLNNQLVAALDLKFKPNEMLILTPHCLQSSKCDIKVSLDVEACTRCGCCKVSDLKSIQQEFGIAVVIATGGTLARKMIIDKKPRLILAVACERDLVSGIIDSKKVFTYGLFNQRPNGPCLDTDVQIDAVKAAIHHFLLIG